MGRSRVAMGDTRQRVERSTAYQEEWMIKEEVTVSSSGEIVVQEVSRTLVETWKSDVRRVCDEFNISTGDAEQKLKEADKDADVKKELEPLRLGQMGLNPHGTNHWTHTSSGLRTTGLLGRRRGG